MRVAKNLYIRAHILGLFTLIAACSADQPAPAPASNVIGTGAGAPAVAPVAQVCALATHLSCGGVCVDATTDPRNCGACGRSCGQGTCAGGICACPSNLLACSAGCVDTLTDRMNCGACSRVCAATETCQLGQCVSPAAACNPACVPGQVCVGGMCQCMPGQTLCDGVCLDTQTTPQHCGACGKACVPGQLCQAGACVCPPGQLACAAGCIDPQTSNTDCGACGAACAASEVCMAGKCRAPIGADGCAGVARDISVAEISAFQSVKIPLTKGVTAIATPQRTAAVVQGRKTVFRVGVTLGSGFMPRELSARVIVSNGASKLPFFAKQRVTKSSVEAESATLFQVPVPAEQIKEDTQFSVELVECGEVATGMMQQARFPAMGEAPLDASKTGVLKVKIIPLKANNRTPDTSENALKVYRDYLEAMYPIEKAELSVGEPLNVTYPVNWSTTLDQIRQLRTRERPASDVYYYGMLRPTETLREYCRSGCTAGVGYVGSPTQAQTRVAMGLAFGDETSAGVMAHEVGHNHGRQHAPCAPGNQISGVDTAFPNRTANTDIWGYDSRKQTFLGPDKTKDIMSYCDPKWISNYTYKALIDRVTRMNTPMFVIPAESSQQSYRVLLTDKDGPRWSQPFAEPDEPFGEPEEADVLDIDGRVVERVTVYRTVVGDHEGATLLIPPAKRGWNAVRTADGVSLAFSAPISVDPPR